MADELTTWKGRAVEPLDENQPLNQGDRVIIRFKWFLGGGGTYLKSVQLAVIDKKLEGRSDFRILTYVDQGEYLDVEVEVLQGSEPQVVDPNSGVTQASLVGPAAAVVVVAISAAVISVTFALLYHSCYKYSMVASGKLPPSVLKSSTGELTSGLKVLSYAALVCAAGYVLLRFFRR